MIYVVEDDRSIRELECYALTQAGFETEGFENGADFHQALQTRVPWLVLLDVMLPNEDGYSILKRLRNNHHTKDIPIVMVTAKGDEMDKVQALDSGADDYIVKPFGVMELISRVKAVLRRSQKEDTGKVLCISLLTMDIPRHKVAVDGKEISLTHMEFELLRYLMLNQGIALSREQLLDAVWGIHYVGDTRTVDVHMRSLRVKLGEMSGLLQTVRGVGYRMEAEYATKGL